MSIDAKLVMKLREMTGAGVLESRTALQETAGDIDKAITVLRIKGIVKAAKKQDRATGCGRVGSYIHSNGRVGAMVELFCETDFVAKTDAFQELLRDLCLQVAGAAPTVVTRDQLPAAELEEEKRIYAKDVAGKPPDVAAKILEGKLAKNYYSKRVLLDQPFVNEAKFQGTIADLIKSKISQVGENLTVRRIARFEV